MCSMCSKDLTILQSQASPPIPISSSNTLSWPLILTALLSTGTPLPGSFSSKRNTIKYCRPAKSVQVGATMLLQGSSAKY
jgi:hypothetical protein